MMASDQAALMRARDAFQAGNPAEAARACQQALQADPGDADAWCLLGIAQRAAGQAEQAVASYREALRLRPAFIEVWNNLGNALVNLGRLDEAVAAFDQVLRLRPEFAEAHNNLGAALRQQGKWAEAAARYQYALRLRPNYSEAHNNLGDALLGLGRMEEAAESYRRALQLRPNFPEALTNLGNVLTQLGRPDEALAAHREALRLRPGYADAYSNLGNTLFAQRCFPEAETCYHDALRLKPDYAEAHHNLGTALAEQGRLAEADACYRKALRLKPDYTDAAGNLATALIAQGEVEEALAVYDRMLADQPDSPTLHMSRALVLLGMGRWEQGWKEYEWRWRTPEFGGMPFSQPLWDGSEMPGRTLLVHTEQGLGDTILAVRYVPLVKRRSGATVVFACPKALLRLLGDFPGADRIVEQGVALPDFDCHAPLLSLPGIFRTTPDSVPAEAPYLHADGALVEQWGRELPVGRDFKVGIAWQGNPRFPADRWRSIPLARFAPLAAVEGVRLYSLQKGHGSEQLREIPFPVVDLGPRLDETAGAFMDTAAVLKNLDLLIAADTAAIHLAGALGVPVWLAQSFAAHWVWLRDREDSPWYPSVRIFRQKTYGNWEEVFARMATELTSLAAAPRPAGTVLVEVSSGELIDKITILQIKNERIGDAGKLRSVRHELAVLLAARDRSIPQSAELERLSGELKVVNEALWEIEDEIRRCEREQDFGSRFIELARSVYRTNDHRAALKRQVSELLRSSLKEEKSYSIQG
jgi:tetratricopeptide (TPR) repeat protein